MKKTNTKNNTRVSSKKANNRRSRNNRNRKYVSHGNAPAAVSDDLQQYVRFSSGSKDGSLRLTACVPMFQICGNGYNAGNLFKGGFIVGSGPSAGFPYATLSSTEGHYVTTADTVVEYISPIFKLISTAFVRYRILKLRFIYEPQSATTIQDRLVFAYANDPEHPLLKQTKADAEQANLLALSDSVAFAPWRSWELDVSSEVKQDLLYTYNQASTSITDNRFNMFGSIGCLASVEPSTDTEPPVYGILYSEITFEFLEFCPLVTGFTPSTLNNLKLLGYKKCCNDSGCKRCTKECIQNFT